MGRVYLQIDGLTVYTLVVAGDTRSFVLNLPLDVRKLGKLPMWYVVKFRPFILACNTGRCVWNVYFVVLRLIGPFTWNVDEL